MAKHLDEQVAAFRNRPLDQGPHTFLWVDALTQKVREGGPIINVHALIAVGVNADGQREILGLDVATAEDGAGWLAFLRSLIARGLTGVTHVISDAHAGLVDAIGAVLPGASWQRCRTHYARNLLSQVPQSAQPSVAALLRPGQAQDQQLVPEDEDLDVLFLCRSSTGGAGKPGRWSRRGRPGAAQQIMMPPGPLRVKALGADGEEVEDP
jgi:transposase-like protein